MGRDRVRFDEGTVRRETALLYCLAGLPLCHCADRLETGVRIGSTQECGLARRRKIIEREDMIGFQVARCDIQVVI
jgi:hypothetical protein